MTDDAKFLGVPRGEDARAARALVVTFGVAFAVLYAGASFLSAFVPWRVRVDLPLESQLPFVPEASLVYLSITPMLAMAPFVLRGFHRLYPLFVALCLQTLIAALCFVLLPVETGYPARHASGLGALPFALADLVNLERNELPSLHIAYATSAVIAYAESGSRPVVLALAAWLAAIVASVLLMHEHHLVDIATGLALGAAATLGVRRRLRRPGVIEDAAVELRCALGMVSFSRRHLRDVVVALAICRASFARFRDRRVLCTGFCLLQAVDDVLDGHRGGDPGGDSGSRGEPLTVTDRLVVALESGRFSDDPLSRLAATFDADAARAGLARGDVVPGVVALIRTMQRDRRRVTTGELATESELRAHRAQRFRLLLDLALAAGGSELRAADVPSLAEALGWWSVVRDLSRDPERGLVNVPREVIDGARAQGLREVSFDALRASPVAREWLTGGRVRAVELCERAVVELRPHLGETGASVLTRLARHIGRVARRQGSWE